MIWAVASNAIVNQHANINRTIEIIKDTSKLEFFVVQDNFMTVTAQFADLVLPACTQFETWGMEDGWKYGEELILQPQDPGYTLGNEKRLRHLRCGRRQTRHQGAIYRGP